LTNSARLSKALYISLASDLWTSTLFRSPDCRLLPNPWICLPVSTVSQILCDIILLSPAYSPEELKISTLTLPDSKKISICLMAKMGNIQRGFLELAPTILQGCHQILEFCH
ncbi:hypothetical protein AMECASPLE_021928, partial [Ameca splendens]